MSGSILKKSVATTVQIVDDVEVYALMFRMRKELGHDVVRNPLPPTHLGFLDQSSNQRWLISIQNYKLTGDLRVAREVMALDQIAFRQALRAHQSKIVLLDPWVAQLNSVLVPEYDLEPKVPVPAAAMQSVEDEGGDFIEHDMDETTMHYDDGGLPWWITAAWLVFMAIFFTVIATNAVPDYTSW